MANAAAYPRHSALADHPARTAAPAPALMSEQALLTHWCLRGDPAALNGVLTLPDANNTFCRDERQGIDVYWRGPDEWLLIGDDGFDAPAALGDALTSAGRHALIDLSCGQTVIALSGANARDVLASGCTLDLHPNVFQTGDCAQTLIAGCSVLLARYAADNDDEYYRLVVRRSFAEHLWLWLHDAAQQLAGD